MPAQFTKHFVQDLQQDIKIRQCGTIVFNADNLSNVITVDLYNGTEPYSGGGTVAGAVICPDGATVALDNGTLTGNVASVTLKADCFAIPGQIGVGVQVISGSIRTTVLKAIYNVELLSTDNMVDPDSRITASVTQLVADIEAATAEIPASDMASLMSGIAPTFSDSTNYAAGAYVYYSGTLYRFTADHAAGSWTGTDATAVAIGNDVEVVIESVTNYLPDGINAAAGFRVAAFIPGRYSTPDVGETSEKTDVAGWVCAKLPATKDDYVEFDGEGTSNLSRLYAILDSSEKVLFRSSANASGKKTPTMSNYPTAAYIIVNSIASYTGKTYLFVGDTLDHKLAGKQNVLTFDSVPTEGSANPVTSAGILSAIQTAVNDSTNYKRQLTADDNLNNINEIGMYIASSSVASSIRNNTGSSPTVAAFAMVIFGRTNNSSSGANRTAILVNSNSNIWVRYCSSSGWNEWNRILTDVNVDSLPTNGSVNPVTSGGIYTAISNVSDDLHNAIDNIADGIISLYGNLKKGNWSTGGAVITGNGISTPLYHFAKGDIINVDITNNWIYTVWEGETPDYLSRTHQTVNDSMIVLSHPYVGFILYKTENGTGVNTEIADYDGQIILRHTDNLTDVCTRDVPQNAGTANVIRRAYQLTDIQFSTLAAMPGYGSRTYTAGKKYAAIPYSSARVEMGYVPQSVSLDTFMTALLNPNSYLYTRRMNIPGYVGHTYYGSVCSAFVAWCYGIDDVIPTTISFDTYPGFSALPSGQQNAQSLQLGDMLNKSAVHIVIITDVYRNRYGEIAYIEVSEETSELGGMARCTIKTPAEIESEYFNSGYVAYRYEYISGVNYQPSPWIHVDISEHATPTYNHNMIPRRGDNANWPEGETVVIDILDQGDYTGYMLTNIDSNTSSTGSISGDTISLSNLSPARYKLALTGSGTTSDYVYFDVIRTQGTTYTVQSGRSIKVEPIASLGTPTSVCFCCNCPDNGSDHLAVRSFYILTDSDRENGYAITTAPPASSKYAPTDQWYMRCMYQTEFGLYAGQLTLIDVNNVGAIITEGAYERSPYIENYPT